MAKRSLDEFLDLSAAMEQPIPNAQATVHGIVAAVSPMKKSKSGSCAFFDGQFTDGCHNVRLFGFDERKQKELVSSFEKSEPVILSNVELKKSTQSGQVEIMVKKHTSISKSPGKFSASDVDSIKKKIGCKEIRLGQLSEMANFDKVTVKVKAIHVGSKVDVGVDATKQDVSIADDTATSTLTLWGEDIDSIVEGKSYELSNVLVRIYQNNHYLSKSGDCTISDIEEIVAIEHCGNIDEQLHVLYKAEVVAVPKFDMYQKCMSCNKRDGKVIIVPDTDDELGQCVKCETMQRLSKCKVEVSSKITVEGQECGTVVSLNGFRSMLTKIVGEEKISKKALLKAAPFKVVYNDSNVIVDVCSTV